MAVTLQSSSPPSFCVISDGIKVYKDKIRRTAGGSIYDRGKIIKTQDRSSQPSTSSSIPSKYQTFFKSATENKGFHRQAPRFEDYLYSNDNPGPGSYLYNPSSFEQNSTSYSKQGTGGLASKTKRFSVLRKTKLGPGSYNPSVPPKRYSFNKSSVTSNFHHPFAPPVDDSRKSDGIPAPNSYDINSSNDNKPAACAAFKSRYKRNEPFKLYTATNPAPGQYDIDDTSTRALPHSHVSSFKTVLKRNEMFTPQEGPGPGSYCPSLINKVPKADNSKHNRSRHLLTFSAPAIPLPPRPSSPGPGHYEVVDYSEPVRYECSGAVFLSGTSRYHHKWSHDEHPGPGSYQPTKIGKQSFLYNLDAKWI